MQTRLCPWLGPPFDADAPTGAVIPWTETGGAFSTVPAGRKLVLAAGGGHWSIELHPADPALGVDRSADLVELQATIQVQAQAAGGWSTDPTHLAIEDGQRAAGVSIGSSLLWIDPSTGLIIRSATTSNPSAQPTTYLLRKDGTAGWELLRDGELVDRLAYVEAPALAGRAQVRVGVVDATATATVVASHLSMALNASLAPVWKVSGRMAALLPTIVRNRYLQGMLWTLVSLWETVDFQMRSLWSRLTAGVIDRYVSSWTGEVLPSGVSPAWSLTNAGQMSLVRGRLRMDGPALQVMAELSPVAAGVPFAARSCWFAKTDVVMRSWTPDAQGRAGPYLWVDVGAKVAVAQLVLDTASSTYNWRLTQPSRTGALTYMTDRRWPVDPLQLHQVELLVFGELGAVLLVNRRVVDVLPWASVSASGAGSRIQIGIGGGPAASVADFAYGSGGVTVGDPTVRQMLITSAIERTVHVGGCEPGEIIGMWNQRWLDNAPARGTTRGILMELARLTCYSGHTIVRETQPASWYLEYSWPEVTPIFLEVDGLIQDVFVEIHNLHKPPLLSWPQLAALARRYLVPLSAQELEYWICLATVTTVNAPAPVGGEILLDVESTDGFFVDDVVTLRDAANTIAPESVVTEIVSTTQLRILSVTGTFFSGSVLRKTLATT